MFNIFFLIVVSKYCFSDETVWHYSTTTSTTDRPTTQTTIIFSTTPHEETSCSKEVIVTETTTKRMTTTKSTTIQTEPHEKLALDETTTPYETLFTTTIEPTKQEVITKITQPIKKKTNTEKLRTAKYCGNCGRPHTWETTRRGETRDFFRILKHQESYLKK